MQWEKGVYILNVLEVTRGSELKVVNGENL
jgi:hypothetical protein